MRGLRSGLLGALVMALLGSQSAACSEGHKVGGKAVGDVFSDPRVAALARAACEGDQAAIERELKGGVDSNGLGFDAVTPLFWALHCENLTGVEALLKAGADPNHNIAGGFSSVYAASTMENSAFLKILLKYGGDPNADDIKAGDTALSQALSLGIHGEGWDNYYSLLEAGADINREYGDGNTIAIRAAALNQYDKVAELLERGYNSNLDTLVGYAYTGEVARASRQWEWREKVRGMLKERGVNYTSISEN